MKLLAIITNQEHNRAKPETEQRAPLLTDKDVS